MQKPYVYIDFETRSTIDLKKAGADVYSKDECTDALCMAYAFDDKPAKLWKLGEPFPKVLGEAIKAGASFIAHNAAFEFVIWNNVCCKKYGWPPLPIRQLYCTMVRAYAMGLPGKLETAGKAVGLKVEKDMQGHRIMMQLSKPRGYDPDGTPIWWQPKDSTPKMDIAEKYRRTYEYCVTDIVVERELFKRVLPLSETERKLWIKDQEINQRGVYVDLKIINRAIELVESEKKILNLKMRSLTCNQVSTCNAAVDLKRWFNIEFKKHKIEYECEGVAKDLVLIMLELPNLPKVMREVLKLRQIAARNSVAKLKKMSEGAGKDARVRGCFQYYGAASTGRWAGRRIQLHNLPRPKIKHEEIEEVLALFETVHDPQELRDYINIFHGSPTSIMSDCLRAMLCAAPGKKLITVDFSQIEARVLAWLAGEEKTLQIFRGHGKIYEHAASGIYNVPLEKVTKDQRLVGKVSILALGYQGGVGAFQSMAKNYFIKVPDKQADKIKVAWRLANPNIVQYWRDLNTAAIAAVQTPGQKTVAGSPGRQVTFLKRGSFLFCRLPSGRAICYPYPQMKMTKLVYNHVAEKYEKFNSKKEYPSHTYEIYDKYSLSYKGVENFNWITKIAYGGLICENICQAVARDLLAEGLMRWEAAGYKVVMHVHDELVAEVNKNFGSLEDACDLLCEVPAWAENLPIVAEGWVGQRYRK